jgi:hypothetical protein
MTLKLRQRLGEDITKKYQAMARTDRYAAAVDAIADILLATAQDEGEATKILHGAEVEYRNAAESEAFVSEG